MVLKVFVMVIEHRHGINVEVYRSMELAMAGVVKWAEEQWPMELGELDMPEDKQIMVETYFEKVDDEDYIISEGEIALNVTVEVA